MNELCPSCREPLNCTSGDGGATIEFDMDDTTAALAQELGLRMATLRKLMIYCGATGTDVDYVFDAILGRLDT